VFEGNVSPVAHWAGMFAGSAVLYGAGYQAKHTVVFGYRCVRFVYSHLNHASTFIVGPSAESVLRARVSAGGVACPAGGEFARFSHGQFPCYPQGAQTNPWAEFWSDQQVVHADAS
jgi:hypothetical protein